MSDSQEPVGRRMHSARDIVRYAFAGAAVLTVVSKRTDTRFTFRISAPKDEAASAKRFVGVRSGDGFTYIGMIHNTAFPRFRLTRASQNRQGTPSVRAVSFLCERVLAHPEAPLPADLEVWHEGRCGKCGRPLTVPESIDRGIGPECWARMGGE